MKICRVMENKKGLVHVQVLDNGHLCWSNLQVSKAISLSTEVKSIPADDILHVKVKSVSRNLTDSDFEDSTKSALIMRTHRLLVHYVKRTEKKRLRMGTCVMAGTLSECQALANDINAKRQDCGEVKEGRRLLVLLNPVSGRGKALAIYREKVEPLLNACEISADVITSTHSGKLGNAAKNQIMEPYDGVVVIGGDGSFNEVINGFLRRNVTESGRDIDDFRTDIAPLSVPIGVIPAGTGNALAELLYGNIDVTTAVIHIIRGKTVKMSAVSTHDPKQLLCISTLVSHIGFVGDLMHLSEQNRWMGPARYGVASHAALLKRRHLTASLSLHTANGRNDPVNEATTSQNTQESALASDGEPSGSCSTGVVRKDSESQTTCVNISSQDSESTSIDTMPYSQGGRSGGGFSWVRANGQDVLEGEMYNVFFSISQLLNEQGVLEPMLGRDTMCLQVAMKSGLSDLVRHLMKVRDNSPGMASQSSVRCRHVKAVQLTFTDKDSQDQTWYINSDGESIPLKANTCYIRLHPRVLTVFGSGQ